MWTAKYIISQVFVILAALSFAVTFFVKNKKIIVGLNCLNSFFYAIQFLLLGAYTGAIVNIMSIIRCIWIFNDERNNNAHSLFTYMGMNIMFIAGAVISYSGWWDLIALAAGLLYNYLLWQSNYKVYRWLSFVASMMWIAYDLIIKSIIGVTVDCILCVVEICGVINIYYQPKKKIKNPQN